MHNYSFIRLFLFDFMSSRYSISILGCGWLGLPLAKSFITDGVRVKGSTTSPGKLSMLQTLGIEPYLVQFSDAEGPAGFPEFLDSSVLIILVPPGRDPQKQENYFRLLNGLTRAIDKSSISKIIFVSSTSVYGETNETFSETGSPRTDTETGKRMLAAEEIISTIADIPVYILRLAGLIGPGRHPGRFFAGKKEIPNGLAPVNLIHQADAVGIVRALVTGKPEPGIFNGCAPDHPSRQDFYTYAAEKLGVPLPQFLPERKTWKIISGEKAEKELSYRFMYRDLMRCLDAGDL
jgi:nucleoside-diphosphate-sugar epimerase